MPLAEDADAVSSREPSALFHSPEDTAAAADAEKDCAPTQCATSEELRASGAVHTVAVDSPAGDLEGLDAKLGSAVETQTAAIGTEAVLKPAVDGGVEAAASHHVASPAVQELEVARPSSTKATADTPAAVNTVAATGLAATAQAEAMGSDEPPASEPRVALAATSQLAHASDVAIEAAAAVAVADGAQGHSIEATPMEGVTEAASAGATAPHPDSAAAEDTGCMAHAEPDRVPGNMAADRQFYDEPQASNSKDVYMTSPGKGAAVQPNSRSHGSDEQVSQQHGADPQLADGDADAEGVQVVDTDNQAQAIAASDAPARSLAEEAALAAAAVAEHYGSDGAAHSGSTSDGTPLSELCARNREQLAAAQASLGAHVRSPLSRGAATPQSHPAAPSAADVTMAGASPPHLQLDAERAVPAGIDGAREAVQEAAGAEPVTPQSQNRSTEGVGAIGHVAPGLSAAAATVSSTAAAAAAAGCLPRVTPALAHLRTSFASTGVPRFLARGASRHCSYSSASTLTLMLTGSTVCSGDRLGGQHA